MHRPDIVRRILSDGDERIAAERADAAAGRRATAILFNLPQASQSSVLKASPASKLNKIGSVGFGDRQAVGVTETTIVTPQIVARILPPVVDIVEAPSTFSTTSVVIHYRVRSDTPLDGALRVAVNGEWQPAARSVSQIAASDKTLVVNELPARDATIRLVAKNAFGDSEPKEITLRWVGRQGETRPTAIPIRKPNLYVLAVGVSQYNHSELGLGFADRDAEQVVSALSGQSGKIYNQIIPRVLLNGKATRDQVREGLLWLRGQVASGDIAILFLAGHGLETSDNHYFFAPADFDPTRIRETGIEYPEIRDALVEFAQRGNRSIFLVDTCYSGAVLGTNTIASSGQLFAEDLARTNYVVGMTSSSRNQPSIERPEWGDGAFTKALVEGIVEARADAAQTGQITMLGLGSYVSQRVSRLTTNAQMPVFMAPPGGFQDFSIAAH